MKAVLIETHYLPPISYFSAIQPFDQIVLEKHEFFVKQSYRNRCHLNTAHGRGMFTVPLTTKHGKVPICEIRIDHSQKWLSNHWRSIQSAYGKAPFFEYYAEDLHHILVKKFEFLYDLNYHLLSLCLSWLKMKRTITETEVFEKNPIRDVLDLRNVINAKNPTGSNKYYKPVEYNQVFGNMFVKDLSLIDLIFCAGPEATKLVQISAAGTEQKLKDEHLPS